MADFIFFKNTFYPEHFHWLLPVFNNKNYFVERIHLIYSTLTIRSSIEVQFHRNLICFVVFKALSFSMIMQIYTVSCVGSWKTCFNIVVGVISSAVRIEISGLLVFLSKCVMWGRVNIVGHARI